MNEVDYAVAEYCGACIEIAGPNGKVKVKIIDRCPECQQGDVDLSPEAFDQIGDRIDGRISISWIVVPCEVKGPIVLYFKKGSTQYWTALQIRNHKTAISTVEYYRNGQWINMPRERYNYFVEPNGTRLATFDIRITDVYGEQIVQSINEIIAEAEIQGTEQFLYRVSVALKEPIIPSAKIRYQDGKLDFGDNSGKYQVIDLCGRIVTTGFTGSQELLEVDNGIYIVRLRIGQRIFTQKVIVE